REAAGIRDLAECTRARGDRTAARQMLARAAHLTGADLEAAHSLAATEIATALHLPEGTARALLEEAEELALHHEPVLAALAAGAVSYAHARIVNDECSALRLRIPLERPRDTDDQARTRQELETAMLAASRTLETVLLAHGATRTPAQLRDKARRLSDARDRRTRHEHAAAARDAWYEPRPDGMGRVCLSLPAVQAQALIDRIRRIATDRAGDPAETRTANQLRADTLADLALAGTPGNAWDHIRGHVLVLIPHHVLTNTGTGGTGTDAAG
ncbi:13E12 repeat family protein, partial [Arthrobacter ginkgonis]